MAQKKTYKKPVNALKNAPYKNPKLSVKTRVKDLLSRMTIEEKVWQLMGLWNGGVEDFSAEFLNDPEKMKSTFGNSANSVHPAFWPLKETVEQRNKIQKYCVENTRLGIPVLFVDEGQHGMMRRDATAFPQAIGLACSWDPQLFENTVKSVRSALQSGLRVVFLIGSIALLLAFLIIVTIPEVPFDNGGTETNPNK